MSVEPLNASELGLFEILLAHEIIDWDGIEKTYQMTYGRVNTSYVAKVDKLVNLRRRVSEMRREIEANKIPTNAEILQKIQEDNNRKAAK